MSGNTYPHFQNYEILDLIGAGGMGSVYRAKDRLGKTVALKVIHDELSMKEEFRERFYEEARHLDGLGDHPNIVNLTGLFGESRPSSEHEMLYIVMEYVEGIDVSALMAGTGGRVGTGLLPESSALPVLRQATDAIAFAHTHGVFHRDIKPSNILVPSVSEGPPVLLTERDVKIMDFGIARTRFAPRITRIGVIGTPEYMAPELFEEGLAGGGELTDVYALGITAYEMLTNAVPFRSNAETTEAAALVQIAREKLAKDPPSPSSHYPPLDEGVEAVVMKAIARRPEDRFSGASEMLEAIDAEIHRLGIALPTANGAVAPAAVPDHTVGEIASSVEDVRQDDREEDSAAVTVPVAMAIWSAAALSGAALGYFAL
jgi:eukaryotic-like serine/threonine-protein kinase